MRLMVQDLLDYYKIRSGKFQLKYKRFNIRECVRKVMDLQRRKAESLGISLEAIFVGIKDTHDSREEDGDSPFIVSDEQRIMQVLLNL